MSISIRGGKPVTVYLILAVLLVLMFSGGLLVVSAGTTAQYAQDIQRYNRRLNDNLSAKLYRDYPWMTNAIYQSLLPLECYEPYPYNSEKERYRQIWRRHPRNIQHYEHNTFLIAENEFNRMMRDDDYVLKKGALTLLNAGLTHSLTLKRSGYNISNMLKNDDVLIQNALLHVLHKSIGEDQVHKPEGYMTFDVHVHSNHSFDGTGNLEHLLLTAHKKGLDAIAITDHDFFDETHRALRVANRLKEEGKLPPSFTVINGMEISAREGHILALYIKSYIPAGMNAKQTIEAIHAQGGLAIAPHPFQPEFGVGGKLIQTLDFDGMVITGAGSEFALSLLLADEMEGELAILMDSDTHVESGLAWFGYALAKTDSISARALYDAIQRGRTQPVHQNIMHTQSRLAGSPLGRTIVNTVYHLYNVRHTVERTVSSFLLADGFAVKGLVPDGLQRFQTFPTALFAGKRPKSLMDKTVLRGFDVVYGPVYLSYEWINRQANWQVGYVQYW